MDRIAVTADGRYLVVPRADGTAIYDLTTSSVAAYESTVTSVNAVATNHDAGSPNQFAYEVTSNNVLSAIDLRTGSPTFGKIVATVSAAAPDSYFSSTLIQTSMIAVSGDGSKVFTSDNDGLVTTIDTRLLLTNPGTAASNATTYPDRFDLDFIRENVVDLTPVSGAPTVTGVSPPSMTADAPATLTITGTNFAPGAVVWIGRTARLTANFISSTQLQVTVPAGQTSGTNLDIVVTLPNTASSIDQQNLSGALKGAFTIQPPSGFADTEEIVAVTNSNSVDVVHPTPAYFEPAAPPPITLLSGSLAVTTDGAYAVVPLGRYLIGTNAIDIVNLSSGTHTVSAPLDSTVLSGMLIVRSVAPGTSTPVMYVTDGSIVYTIDGDPASQTFGTVLASNPSGVPLTNTTTTVAMTATPDGHYVYVILGNTDNVDADQRLLVFDQQAGTLLANLSLGALGADPYPLDMQVTPDGKYLITDTNNDSLGLFDISANPASPTLAHTVGTVPGGFTGLTFLYFAASADRLYAVGYASPGNVPVLEEFAYEPVDANFAFLGSYTSPALGQGPLAVSGDLSRVYVTNYKADAIQVLDAAKVAASDPSPVLASLGAPFGPRAIGVPSGPQPLTYDLALAATHTPEPAANGGAVTFTFTTTNNGADVSNATITSTLPSGTSFVQGNSPCTVSSSTVTCALGTLTRGQTASTFFIVTAPTTGTSFSLSATVSSFETNTAGDQTPGNNTYLDTVNLTTGADLSVAASASPSTTTAGGSVTFSATVTNNGGNGTIATMAATLPPGFTPVSATWSNPNTSGSGNCTVSGNSLSCPVGSLPYTGTPTTASISVVATAGTQLGTFSLGVTASGTAPDPVSLNNSANAAVLVALTPNAQDALLFPLSSVGTIAIYNTNLTQLVPEPPVFTAQPRHGPVVLPNGRIAFVPRPGAQRISVVDLSIGAEIDHIKDISVTNPLALSPDGRTIVAVNSTDTISLIDTVTYAQTQVNLNGLVGDDSTNSADIKLGAPAIVGRNAYFNASGLLSGSLTNGIPLVVLDLDSHAVTTISLPTTSTGVTKSGLTPIT
ncbi:MAG: IPT/TIG domain-containing protein, partial [Terriglobales bacterium]